MSADFFSSSVHLFPAIVGQKRLWHHRAACCTALAIGERVVRTSRKESSSELCFRPQVSCLLALATNNDRGHSSSLQAHSWKNLSFGDPSTAPCKTCKVAALLAGTPFHKPVNPEHIIQERQAHALAFAPGAFSNDQSSRPRPACRCDLSKRRRRRTSGMLIYLVLVIADQDCSALSVMRRSPKAVESL